MSPVSTKGQRPTNLAQGTCQALNIYIYPFLLGLRVRSIPLTPTMSNSNENTHDTGPVIDEEQGQGTDL